jgi:hypothetical protein
MCDGSNGIRLAGGTLGRSRHVCAFFNSQEEQDRVLLPFIQDGIERGDKIFRIVDPQRRQEYMNTLDAAGVPTTDIETSGQLNVCGWDEAYLRGGHFDQDAWLQVMEQVLQDGKAQGFPLTRIMGSVEWAEEDRPLIDSFVEYETRLNYILPKYDDVVVCVYDCSKFGAGLAMDILRTHPMAIIGGILQENPFFIPPDEFLRELRSRADSAASTPGDV